ncbi:MAG: amino acid adenylation domain-containing protein [Bacteroidetes bacterium]|nr:amino acid adenylation domain-containing protein [Bacteroidota bacterium]
MQSQPIDKTAVQINFEEWTGISVYKNISKNTLLHELFEQTANLYPDHIAIEENGRRLSYAEVEHQANQLAHYLTESGVGAEQKVAIMLNRSAFVYIAMLGVLKAGGAYIPLDPEIPGERVDFIMEDSAALLLISSDTILNRINDKLVNRKIFNTDKDFPLLTNFPVTKIGNPALTSANLCYIIYTSGTTGKPKGVLLEHRNVVTYICSAQEIYPINHTYRALQGFSVSFDASVEEIWLPFSVGATVVVGTFEIMRSGEQFSGILHELEISFLSCAPTLLSMVEEDIPGLKILIFGGEVCPPDLAHRWCKNGRKVYNTYGPTEAAVIATYKVLEPHQSVTIGFPMPQYIVMILDEQMNAVDVGQEGEIYIGGECVARGYLNRPEMNQEKFIETSKFTEFPLRFYKTGDIAKYTAAGEIEYVGRIDAQVKVRGFRVELSEIEGLILSYKAVKATAVTLDKNTQQLAAYLVVKSGEILNREELAELLRAKLPYYMIPSTLDEVDALPMTSSSKIDRSRLPQPQTPLAADQQRECILPETPLEKELHEILKKHFKREDISMDDNFFNDLGGHSLLAAHVASDLRKHPMFNNLSVIDIYNFPILKDLATHLETEYTNQSNKKKEIHDFYKPSRLSYYSCWFFQGVSLIFLSFLFGIEWLGPFFVYAYYYHADYGVIDSLLIMLLTYFLLLPTLTLFAIAFKWMVIGKIKAGKYKLWSLYYFRFWIVDKVIGISPASYFAGTPIITNFYRLLGAKIGVNTYINSHTAAAFDLLSIGNNVSICTDTHIKGFTIKDGYLHIGSIEIGNNCFVGTRCCISENTKMERNSSLEDLSLLPDGGCIPKNENWQGSPAQKHGINPKVKTLKLWKENHFTLYMIGVFLFPLITMIAYFPGMMLITHIDYSNEDYRFLALTLFVAMSFVIILSLIIAILKWVLLGSIKEGKYPIGSLFYFRKWFFDQLMRLSLQVIGTLYTTLYLQYWFKMLGVKIGKRSEISTVEFISPDLLVAGDECFLADSVSVGASHVRYGYITIEKTYIGNRTFVGNSAVLSPGTKLGNEVLVGVLSKMKTEDLPATDGSSWFGSPAVYLPKRDINTEFSEKRTYKPSRKLFALRYFIEFFRVCLPATMFITMASMITNITSYLQVDLDLFPLLFVFPLLYIAASFIGFFIMAIFKWIVIGRYRPSNKPLWSGFVWRSELVTGLYENFGVLFSINVLTGTPFIKFPLWLLGCKIGKRTCIYTTQITEFDLVKVGDYSALNDNCTIQTHLFEDRVMKMSYVDIGKECSVGGMSVVLYDSVMEDGAKLDNLSVLMKGETLTTNTTYIGAPARSM